MKKLINLSGIAVRLVIAAVFILGMVQAMISPVKPPSQECPKHYDGEGNEIPEYAVDLYIKSDFVWLSIPEIDTIQRYFYFTTRHLCPFVMCPMKEQIRFHGCGICEKQSACYDLDAIHWENPTWSYDQCWDEYLKSHYKLKQNNDNDKEQNKNRKKKYIRHPTFGQIGEIVDSP